MHPAACWGKAVQHKAVLAFARAQSDTIKHNQTQSQLTHTHTYTQAHTLTSTHATRNAPHRNEHRTKHRTEHRSEHNRLTIETRHAWAHKTIVAECGNCEAKCIMCVMYSATRAYIPKYHVTQAMFRVRSEARNTHMTNSKQLWQVMVLTRESRICFCMVGPEPQQKWSRQPGNMHTQGKANNCGQYCASRAILESFFAFNASSMRTLTRASSATILLRIENG